MAFNDSYSDQPRGRAGLITDARYTTSMTYVQGEASAGIAFGTVVAEGAASTVQGTPDKAINMVNASSKVAGVVVHAHNYSAGTQLNADGAVLPQNLITVMRHGQIWAQIEGTCTKGDPAYVRHTANGGNTVIGKVAGAAGTGLVLCRGLSFGETKAALGDGLVKLNVHIDDIAAVGGLT